eukprot:2261823-Amphidinium_carterae.1
MKLFERLLEQRLEPYLPEQHNQFAYTPGRSAETLQATLVHDVQAELTAGTTTVKRVGILALDLASAFDTVRPWKVLSKLADVGAPVYLLDAIWAFLSDKTHTVQTTDGGKSDWRRIINGLPQGSGLGPKLFAFYIKSAIEQLEAKHDIRLYAFADDLTILASGYSVEEIEKVLSAVYTDAITLFHELGLKISSKTSSLLISTRTSEHKRHMHIYDMDPTRQTRMRFSTEEVANLSADRRSLLVNRSGVHSKLVKVERLVKFTRETLFDYCREQGDVRCRSSELLPAATSLKVVGLVLNSSFTFAPHVAAAIASHYKACQLMRRLRSSSYGPPRPVLSALATTTVQSKVLMHAGVVLPLLSRTQRRKLESLDGKLACLVAHLPQGTPRAAAICEAGLVPIHVRARLQQLRHLAFASTLPESHRIPQVLQRQTTRIAIHMGLGWRADFRSQVHVASDTQNGILQDAMHRWPEASAHCAVSSRPLLCKWCSPSVDASACQRSALKKGSTELWTDGSQRASASGAFAIYSPGCGEPDLDSVLERGFSLPFYVSSTWSELHAIHQALLATPPTLRNGPLWIFTDSQSAILAVCSKTAFCDEVVYNILQCIRGMQQRSLEVKFMHIPAHSGVPRNERVDSMAAKHSSLPTSAPVPATIPLSVFQGLLRKSAFAEWAQKQDSTTAQLYLHAFAQYAAPLRVHRSLTRLQSIVLSQLRCGRSPVVGDLQRRLLDGDPADVPRCKCGVVVTWQHLLSCPLLIQWRPAHLTHAATEVDAGSSQAVVDTTVAVSLDEHPAPAASMAGSSQGVVLATVAECLAEQLAPAVSTASSSHAVVDSSVALCLDEHAAPAASTASSSQAVVFPSVALGLDEHAAAAASIASSSPAVVVPTAPMSQDEHLVQTASTARTLSQDEYLVQAASTARIMSHDEYLVQAASTARTMSHDEYFVQAATTARTMSQDEYLVQAASTARTMCHGEYLVQAASTARTMSCDEHLVQAASTARTMSSDEYLVQAASTARTTSLDEYLVQAASTARTTSRDEYLVQAASTARTSSA